MAVHAGSTPTPLAAKADAGADADAVSLPPWLSASALELPASPPSPGSISSTPSAMSSLTASSTSFSSPVLPRASPGRRFWRRLSVRADALTAAPTNLDAARGPDHVVRTAMYRTAPLPDEDDASYPDDLEPTVPRALRDKEERLQRAARLLLQQHQPRPSSANAPGLIAS